MSGLVQNEYLGIVESITSIVGFSGKKHNSELLDILGPFICARVEQNVFCGDIKGHAPYILSSDFSSNAYTLG